MRVRCGCAWGVRESCGNLAGALRGLECVLRWPVLVRRRHLMIWGTEQYLHKSYFLIGRTLRAEYTVTLFVCLYIGAFYPRLVFHLPSAVQARLRLRQRIH